MIVERLLKYCFDLAGITLVVLMLVTVAVQVSVPI